MHLRHTIPTRYGPDDTPRCATCAAREHGFCGRTATPARSTFAGRSVSTRYEQGGEILAQGEAVQGFGVIVSGLVKIVMLTESGDDHLLQILSCGQLIGDPGNGVNRFSWEAATDAEVCWFTRDAWRGYLNESPRHYEAFVETLARQHDEARQAVLDLRGRSTVQRVAWWIVRQIPEEKLRRAAAPRLRIQLTRRDLASLLDMTVETLCRALHQLDEKGAIHMISSDFVEIRDIVKLRVLGKLHDPQVMDRLTAPALGTVPSVGTIGQRPPRAATPRRWTGAGAELTAPAPMPRATSTGGTGDRNR